MLPVLVPATLILNVALDARPCAMLHAIEELPHVLRAIIPRLSALACHFPHVKSALVRFATCSEVVNTLTVENVLAEITLIEAGVRVDLLAVALLLVQIKSALEVASIAPRLFAVALLVEVDPITLVGVPVWGLDPAATRSLVIDPVTDVVFARWVSLFAEAVFLAIKPITSIGSLVWRDQDANTLHMTSEILGLRVVAHILAAASLEPLQKYLVRAL